MSNNQNASGKFRPFVISEFRPGDYIHTGGDVASPWRNGLKVMAENHNTIMARHGHVLVNQSSNSDISVITGPGPIKFAQYVVRVPSIPGRSNLTVLVLAETTGGTTFRVRASTAIATSSWSGFTASGGDAQVTVDITPDAYKLVSIEFELSGAGDFHPQNVFVLQTAITTTDIGAYSADPINARHMPQDTDSQYGADRALSVVSIRDLLASQDEHFKKCGRHIVNSCYWGDWASISTVNRGFLDIGYDADIDGPRVIGDFVYFPRDGVQRLAIFLAGETNGYTAFNGARVNMQFYLGPTLYTSGDVEMASATTVVTEGNYLIWGDVMKVKNGPGPMFIKLKAWCPGSGTHFYVKGLTIIEDPDWIE